MIKFSVGDVGLSISDSILDCCLLCVCVCVCVRLHHVTSCGSSVP